MNSNDVPITYNDKDKINQGSSTQSSSQTKNISNLRWRYAATDQHQNHRYQIPINILSDELANNYQSIIDCSLFHACIGTIQEGLLIVNITGNIIFYNQSADEILNLVEAGCKSIYDTNLFKAVNEDNVPLSDDTHPINICLRDGIVLPDTVIGIEGVNDEMNWVVIRLQPIFFGNDGQQSLFILTLMDISADKISAKKIKEQLDEIRSLNILMQYQMRELEKANAQIEVLAIQDELTGLKNYRAFHERLNTEVIRSKRYHTPLSIVILDVDRLKEYNDKYGHSAGDRVLKQLADILLINARNTDIVSRCKLEMQDESILIARNGAEEFSLILPHTDIEGAMHAAERLRHAIEKTAWEYRPITASFGVASLIHGIDNANSLMAAADQALYRSKFQGRNRVNSGNIYTHNS